MNNNVIDYSKIDIKNNLMFCTVMKNPELCRQFLERVLNISIKEIRYVHSEKNIDIAIKSKSIRLDVYANDDKGTIYNIEMQNASSTEIPKRSRYYSSLIDLDFLHKGQSYRFLPQSIILFICDFDLFPPYNQPIYCFENRCTDNNKLSLNDGTMKAFVNIKGDLGKVSNQLKSLLQYFDTGKVSDEFTATLDNEVNSTRNNKKWRLEYMTLQDALNEKYELGCEKGIEIGRGEGIKIGEQRLSTLVRLLLADERFEEIRCLPENQDKLYEEYRI
ncbi:MAG: Rpn family recombination-promoting nuclease/putative transposase [Lachnospiraceae bacterium]|nr:Rpn family recombination-promoting nuclease/putative transposase [Lachnospiraceae bacterium]